MWLWPPSPTHSGTSARCRGWPGPNRTMEDVPPRRSPADVQELLCQATLSLALQRAVGGPELSGSADPIEQLDEFLTSSSLSEAFPFQQDVSPTVRTEDGVDGMESNAESLYECFPFQMDRNDNLRPIKEEKASKVLRSPLPCQPNGNQDIRNQCDLNTFRLQLFGAIFENNLERIDGLLQEIEDSGECLSHPKLRDPNTGQTCLMKALLQITNKAEELTQDNRTVDIVKKLLSFSQKHGDLSDLVNATYTDRIYRGQTALHIAVERRRCDLVQLLVENGAAVDVMAKGSFFRNKRNKQCSFYFGGFPLGLAACTNQLDIVIYLIEHGADPRAQDRAGNTVLHALVSIACEMAETRSFVTGMYDLILIKAADLKPHSNLEKITNRKGLTPLQLAAHTGKIGIFKHILGREIKQQKYKHLSRKFTEWEYGPVTCSLYDLSGVDTIEDKSVLQTVVYSSRNRNRHEMLCVEPMNELLQKKWEDFGAYMFLISFLFYLSYILCLTIVASHRPPANKGLGCLFWVKTQIYIILAAVYFVIKEGAEMVYLRRSDLHSVLVDGSFHILFLIQSGLVLIFTSLCWVDVEGSRVVLVLALALGWFNVLYYTRGFKLTGIYCVMIKKIILQDILRFLLVYVVFIVGFAAALASLIEDCPPGIECPFNGFSTAVLELFKLTIGLGDLGVQKHSRFPVFFHMLLVLYVVLTFVLLLNMLIALMGETVTKISSDSEKIWKLQRAVTTLYFERRLPSWVRTRCKNNHSFTDVTVGLTPEGKEDRRWCLRLNEMKWTEWDTQIEATVGSE
ncbi:transient receptor potential cation channel subfamily V member 3-like isoform X2 [Hypanus sabinus]|uniref:transient receptor potential cation channel subfamily V member 3-like isoform X2 n=1 Tax=Hypanus sabinus TaxID=79690 RepID=UPI0028C3CB5F|nr:transient receptor potential cation channel subfamily V member 3-like isoform X2 [Hypanus sabinus]